MGSGVTAKLYGPWLRAEDENYILFINLATELAERQTLI